MKTRVFEHKNKPKKKKSSKGTLMFEMKEEQKRQRQTGRPSGYLTRLWDRD